MTKWRFAVLLSCVMGCALTLRAAGLAPTGTLRASFLGLNPVQGKVDPATGAVTGPVADLVKDLARRLNVPYKLLPEPDARHVIDALKMHDADIGFLANDPARAAEVDFSGSLSAHVHAYIYGRIARSKAPPTPTKAVCVWPPFADKRNNCF